MKRRWNSAAPFCLLAGGVPFLLFLLTFHHFFRLEIADLWVYSRTCEYLSAGEVPNLGFPLEYPPLAALVMAGPRLFGAGAWMHGLPYYTICFAFQCALLGVAAIPAIMALAPRMGLPAPTAASRYIILLSVSFIIALYRFDLFPALVTLLAILCLLDDRPSWAGAWLGVAIAVKVYPLVLIGVFFGYAFSRRRFNDAARMLASMIVAIVLPLTPYIAMHDTAFLYFVHYQRLRGLQIETVAAGLIQLAAHFHWTTLSLVQNYGATHVASPWSPPVLRFLPTIMVIACLAMTVVGYRRMRRDVLQAGSPGAPTVIATCMALLLIFMVLNKVFSPQYLIWVFALGALLDKRKFWLLLAICLFTLAIYPFGYRRLINQDLSAILVLNLRNLLMIWLTIDVAAGLFLNSSARETAPQE